MFMLLYVCNTLNFSLPLPAGGILKLSSDVLHPHSKTVRFASDVTLALSPPKAGGGGDAIAKRPRRRANSVPDLSSSMAPRLQPLGSSVGLDAEGSELLSPALTESLFPGLPPTVHFPMADEECECQHNNVCMYVCTYVCTHVCMYVPLYCTYMCVYVRTYVLTYILFVLSAYMR